MAEAKVVEELVNALPTLFLDFCFQAEDQSRDRFQGTTGDVSMERTISDKDKLQETEALGVLFWDIFCSQRGLVMEQSELTQDRMPKTSSSLVPDGLVTAHTNSMETIPTYKYIQQGSETR